MGKPFKKMTAKELLELKKILQAFPLSYLYPYPSSFSFRGSHLLPGQGLDVISIPFQIYFIQATRFQTHEATIVQFLVRCLGSITW